MLASSTGKTVLWGSLFLLTILSVLSPLNLITVNVILIPLLVMATLSDRIRFAIVFAAIVILPALLFGGYGLFISLMALFYLPPALAMASQYKKEAGAGAAVLAGIIAFIATILAVLLIAFAFRFNLADFITDALTTDKALMSLLETLLGTQANVDDALKVLIAMIPVTIIFFSVYTTVVAHFFARKLLSRFWRPVPKLKPMKEWRLPRSIIWYYLILLIAELFIGFKAGSTMYVVLLNAVPLLTYALALQGVGFLFFTADAKGWNRALPVFSLVLLPFFPQLIAWVGVIDMAFPLRSRMKSKD